MSETIKLLSALRLTHSVAYRSEHNTALTQSSYSVTLVYVPVSYMQPLKETEDKTNKNAKFGLQSVTESES